MKSNSFQTLDKSSVEIVKINKANILCQNKLRKEKQTFN